MHAPEVDGHERGARLGSVYARSTPILPVTDVAQELAFYEELGFRQHTDPSEVYALDEFAAVAHGEQILFGLVRANQEVAVPPAGLILQFEATDLDAVSRVATERGLEVTRPLATQPWGRRTLTIKSPSGYDIGFEDA